MHVACAPQGDPGGILPGRRPHRGRRSRERRVTSRRPHDLTQGPARLATALDIDRALNGADVCLATPPVPPSASSPARRPTPRRSAPDRAPASAAAPPTPGVSGLAATPPSAATAHRGAQKESSGTRSLGKTPYERVRGTERHQEAREP
ncbi:DNA-3-methyladenine glycosylase [Actinacidiphila sp. bgisy160]|uniref:DNA-3-methyladenine glycosylase n=1 Tax=Actinacidiphila sp. bgisy160 TaxID=3413796 RepID=UPI003D71C078